MRLSLLKGAHVALSCAAWQEIRVRDWTLEEALGLKEQYQFGSVRHR
jgi:hypothetical protein